MIHARRVLFSLLIAITLVACDADLVPQVTSLPATGTITQTIEATHQIDTVTPTPEPVKAPACYQTTLPMEIATSFAIQGWQAFASQVGFNLKFFYFPADCLADSLEQDAQAILYGGFVPEGEVGLVILNPVEGDVLGTLYQHLVRHEYWQMGPEDYPALIDDSAEINKKLVFLRFDELNGDNTIIGNPLTVLTSLAEHEYIHIVQSRNNPDLANMVWTDKDYQFLIEGYANIGNVSSQRYYFETQAAIETLQNLDLLNRNGKLQSLIAMALTNQGLDTTTFLSAEPKVYDRHILAFFVRVGGQIYVEGLQQGEISPYALITRAGSGDLVAYKVIQEILKK